MKNNDAFITPSVGGLRCAIAERCVMVSHPADMQSLCRLMRTKGMNSRKLLISRLVQGKTGKRGFSLMGPFIGAPYAVILQEIAISRGAREIIFFGWCGAVSADVHIGEVVLPASALIDDGTSKNYIQEGAGEVFPSAALQRRIKNRLTDRKIRFHEGRIWSTDAVFRETQKKVGLYLKRRALAVEMEAAALFSVGLFRSVDVGSILVVSDELSAGAWVRGFSAPGFIKSRRAVCELLRDMILNPSPVFS